MKQSYIKRDGGREKIKAVGQLLQEGALSETENDSNEIGRLCERECDGVMKGGV